MRIYKRNGTCPVCNKTIKLFGNKTLGYRCFECWRQACKNKVIGEDKYNRIRKEQIKEFSKPRNPEYLEWLIKCG